MPIFYKLGFLLLYHRHWLQFIDSYLLHEDIIVTLVYVFIYWLYTLGSTYLFIFFLVLFVFQVAMRIVDCVFYEGSQVLFLVGLAVLKLNQEAILAEDDSEIIVDKFKKRTYDSEELMLVCFLRLSLL